MSQEQWGGFCSGCQRQTMHLRTVDRPNHAAHALGTLLTGGLWLIPWVMMSTKTSDWRCSQCGTAYPEKRTLMDTVETVFKIGGTAFAIALTLGLGSCAIYMVVS